MLVRSWNSPKTERRPCDGTTVPAGWEGVHVWDISNSDNVIFLAAAIAFNILLAALPFGLFVIWILADLLGLPPDESAAAVRAFVEGFLPSATSDSVP